MERRGAQIAESLAFVFTDVAGSTALWEDAADAMRLAMTRHDELIETAVEAAGGALVRPRGEGDSRFAVFADAGAALLAAARIQTVIAAESWTTPRPIRVRMAVHVGAAQLRDGDYYGTAVNRCARMRGVAHAGQTVASAEAVAVARATGSSELVVRDLGEHRLRDIPDAQRLYQVDAAGAPTEFPPLFSLDVVLHNLPVALEPLVGRDRELAQLSNLLASHRLITLTGPGGTGKTRLSIAAATDALHRFPDGVWLCDLAVLTDPDLVTATVAKTLGVRDDGGDSVYEALAEHVGDKSLLVVMDNCEHVIDAAAKMIAGLLEHTRNASVLATSQEGLAVTGEHVYPIQPLAPSDAISLFEQRARAANPGFVLDDTNEPDVRAICARLDGIPLAVQLAAARVRTLSPAQIRERLHDRFRLLTTANRSAPARQQTLAATLEWSHDLLAKPERVLYRRLGVFHGGAVLEAIEEICTDDALDRLDVLDVLQRLVDRSLVIADHSGTIPRYRMLETMLEHARGKSAAASEAGWLRDRHLGWIRRQAEEGYHGAYGPDAERWWELLRGDGPNRRAALAWSLDGGDGAIGLGWRASCSATGSVRASPARARAGSPPCWPRRRPSRRPPVPVR